MSKKTIILSVSDLHVGAGNLQDFTVEGEQFFKDTFYTIKPSTDTEIYFVLNGDILDFPQTPLKEPKKFLFSIDGTEYQQYLNQKIILNSLKEKFKQFNYELSVNIRVIVKKVDIEWIIECRKDKQPLQRFFIIRHNNLESQLNIYAELLDILPEVPYPQDISLGCDEEQSLIKLNHIIDEHEILFDTLRNLVANGVKIIYLVGNHDADMLWPSLQERFLREIGVDFLQNDSYSIRSNHFPPSTVFKFPFTSPFIHIEHGHQLIDDGNNYQPYWPKDYKPEYQGIFRGIPLRIYQPFGNRFMLYLMNALDKRYKGIDNIKPMSKAAATLMRFNKKNFLVAAHYYWKWCLKDPKGGKEAEEKERKLALEEARNAIAENYNEETPLGNIIDWHNWLLNSEDAVTGGVVEFPQYAFLETKRLQTCAKDLFGKNYSVVICGHTHEPINPDFKRDGGYYINTGTWMPYADFDYEPRLLIQVDRYKDMNNFPFVPKIAFILLKENRVIEASLIDPKIQRNLLFS